MPMVQPLQEKITYTFINIHYCGKVLLDLTDYLIQDLNIQDLDTNEKLALLRILLAYTLPKPKIDNEVQEQKHFTVEVIDKLA